MTEDLSYSIELFHLLHANPGVSGNESVAHNLVVDELRRLSPHDLYEHVGGYGVVAVWYADGSDRTQAPTLAFRADIDALPGGHLCGHDGHTTILLRFARKVAESSRRCHIMLIFQPEEETGMGARKIIESGILQRYDIRGIFGLHNLPGYAKNCVVLNRHTFAAASTGVIYSLSGRPTHASTPELGLNPALASAQIIQRVLALNGGNPESRSFRQATMICCHVGDEEFGVSPGTGKVMFTLRAYTNDEMEHLTADVDAIVVEVAQQQGLRMTKELREPFRATENSASVVDELHALFTHQGLSVSMMDHPFRWSEDFADFLHHFPGMFFGIGIGEDARPLHDAEYQFSTDIIATAVNCFELIMNNVSI